LPAVDFSCYYAYNKGKAKLGGQNGCSANNCLVAYIKSWYISRKDLFAVNNRAVTKVLGGIVLTILWILCFLYIDPTQVINFGGGATLNFKLVAIIIGLLIIFFYHQLYPSPVEVTKLSWTSVATIVWLALILFFPFKTDTEHGGAVGFFAVIGGLAVCVFWVRFFSDEVSLDSK
jgi:hypothetical protein